MNLKQSLLQLGLEEKEVGVYLASLELGPASIQKVTDKSGIKRSTVYEMMKKLKNKGLLSETTKGKRRLIIASEPDQFKQNIENQKAVLSQILPDLKALSNLGGIKPRITFYEGVAGLKEIYMLTLKAKSKTADWVSPIRSAIEMIGEDFLIEYINKRAKMGYWIRSIHITERQYPDYKYLDPKTFDATLRKVKFTPPGIDIPNMMALWDNKIAIMGSSKEGVGFVIESEEFAKSMKVFYELLWNISKPYGDMDFHGLGQKKDEFKDEYQEFLRRDK